MAPTNTTQPDQAFLAEIKDKQARNILRAWTNKYCELSDEIDERKAQQDTIKQEHIEPLRAKLGHNKIETEEWYIARRPGRPSLDKEKVKRYLFDRGVSMQLLLDAFDAATTDGQPYTEIKRRKRKEEKAKWINK